MTCMLKKLTIPYRFFQYSFTYRQRFIFFSLFFLLTIPIPTYWMLLTQNFLLTRWKLQEASVPIQKLSEEILSDLIAFKIAKENPSLTAIDNLLQLKQKINAEAKLLSTLLRTNFHYPASIGKGFSHQPTITHDFALDDQNFELLEKTNLNKSIREMKSYLSQLGIQFNLLFVLDPVKELIIKKNLNYLPDEKILAEQLYAALSQKNLIRGQFYYQILHRQLQRERFSFANFDLLNPYASKENLEFAKFTSDIYEESLANFLNKADQFLQQPNQDLSTLFQALKNFLAVNQEHFKMNLIVFDEITKRLYSEEKLKQQLYLGVLAFTVIVLLIYLMTRMLTSHLFALLEHIQQMSLGNFKQCFCSNSADEFGEIGQTFDKMGTAIKDLVNELQKVSYQLKDSIIQIGKTAKVQEKIIDEQERNLQKIENESNFLACSSKKLVGRMDQLYESSLKNLFFDPSQKELETLQIKMSALSADSGSILDKLDKILQKVKATYALIDFLEKVSDQAALLSLNSSIETSYLHIEKQSFVKITVEIHRFASETAKSTENIQKIIKEVVDNVLVVSHETNHCLKEIDHGAKQLIDLSQQFYSITVQGKEQAKQFDEVNKVMKLQASESENIIKATKHLREFSLQNTQYAHLLHTTTLELDKTTEELHNVLSLFFKGYDNGQSNE